MSRSFFSSSKAIHFYPNCYLFINSKYNNVMKFKARLNNMCRLRINRGNDQLFILPVLNIRARVTGGSLLHELGQTAFSIRKPAEYRGYRFCLRLALRLFRMCCFLETFSVALELLLLHVIRRRLDKANGLRGIVNLQHNVCTSLL